MPQSSSASGLPASTLGLDPVARMCSRLASVDLAIGRNFTLGASSLPRSSDYVHVDIRIQNAYEM